MRKRQRGFTLIEIMVVVVILAVLGALVVPKILENVDKARVTRAASDIRAIQTALDLYRLDNFKYPTGEQGLQALVTQPSDPTITNYRSGGYLPSLPKDPWNNLYRVRESRPQWNGLRHHQLRTRRQARRRRLRRGHQRLYAQPAVVASGCRAMRSKGFTLIEILVVLVIMAMVISLAVLSIGTTGRDTQLDEESRRIQGLVDILHERALLEGRDFGLRIEPTGYGFVVYSPDRDRWLPLTDEQSSAIGTCRRASPFSWSSIRWPSC